MSAKNAKLKEGTNQSLEFYTFLFDYINSERQAWAELCQAHIKLG